MTRWSHVPVTGLRSPLPPWCAWGVLALLGLLAASGCGGGETAGRDTAGGPGGTARGGTLVFGRGGDSVGLDPAHEDDGESYKVCDNLYDTLVQYAPTSTDIVPGLAESWEISEDGRVYTFHLRQGVRFHDGTPVDAAAVAFSFDRQRLEDHPFHNVGGAYKYWNNMGMSDLIDEIEVVDEKTIRFHLTRPEAPFLANLAMNFAAIVSPTALKKYGEDFTRHPVGSGPFKFVEWIRDDRIVLEANDAYWGGRPKMDRVVFRAIPDNTARYLELQTGAIDGMDFPNPDDLPRMKADPSLDVLTQPGMNVGYLALNTRKTPFDDVRVRRALNHAINRQAIVDHLYLGFGEVAQGPLPPGMLGYRNIGGYDYDPAKAKALLAEAGYSEGFETTLWAMPVPRPYMPNGMKVAQAIQADLAKVGVRARIVTYEWGTYLDKTDHGEHDMALLGWSGDNGDPDNFLYVLLDKDNTTPPATNIAFYESEAVHELLIAAKRISDPAQRAAKYGAALELIHADAPWVPIAHALQVVVFRRDLRGFKLHPTNKRRFATIYRVSGEGRAR